MRVIRHWKSLLAQSTSFEVLETQLDKVLINLMELGLLRAEGWGSLPLEVSSKTNFSLIYSPYAKSSEAYTSCLKTQPHRNRRNPKLVIPVLGEWEESRAVRHYPEWQLAGPCLFSCNPILQRHFKHTVLPGIFLLREAHVLLLFGSVAERVLLMHKCFDCGSTVLAQHQGFSSSLLCPASSPLQQIS